jgi:uncharacterized membrane protein YhiD involved in acid resistance
MTFQDFISGTDLAGSDLTVIGIAATLVLSFAMGIFIFWIYKRTYQGVMYSKTFNVSLIALSMITSAVIMAVTSNIILSLGMVGALSIVRFRAAIKDPIDIVYMFWAIASGIIVGAGLYVLAVTLAVIMGVIFFVFSKIGTGNEPMLLIVNYGASTVEDQIFKLLNDRIGTYKVKSKTKTQNGFEIMVEIRSKKDKLNVVNEIDGMESVTNVAMVSYDGDFAA